MRLVCALMTLLVAAGPGDVAADSDATVAVSVHLSSRTSLHVSATSLEFVVPDGGRSATAVIDFVAGARLQTGSAVMLNVDTSQSVTGPGGASDMDAEVTFSGEGEGTTSGTLTPSVSAVAAAWQGSGQHHGRIVFTLHAAAPGMYRVPIQLVLATP